eukprot:1162096-Pelagomonas_calceolata.AAC.2
MSTKGSTVTLSHTPSMPIVDREVQEAAAAAVANSGQVRACVSITGDELNRDGGPVVSIGQ